MIEQIFNFKLVHPRGQITQQYIILLITILIESIANIKSIIRATPRSLSLRFLLPRSFISNLDLGLLQSIDFVSTDLLDESVDYSNQRLTFLH